MCYCLGDTNAWPASQTSEGGTLQAHALIKCSGLQSISVIKKFGVSNLVVSEGLQHAAGKSALLLAMLGELRLLHGGVRGQGRVAYVPQTPWLMAASFRYAFLLPFGSKGQFVCCLLL